MSFTLGRLSQVVHVTDDLTRARWFYRDVLGGQCYYEGYSPYEKRDASIYAIGDATIEPMAPSDEVDAGEYPVGRFLARFGPRLHSIAINATGIPELAEHLVAAGVRVVGPGGVAISEMAADGPQAIYTHPRDSHLLIEFVDFGEPLMPASPRLDPDWDARRRALDHPAGVLGLSHVTALISDADRAEHFFTAVLGAAVVRPAASAASRRTVRVRIGTEMVVELCQPLDGSSDEAQRLAADGEGLYSMTLGVVDGKQTASYLESKGVATSVVDDMVWVDRASAAGARLAFTQVAS